MAGLRKLKGRYYARIKIPRPGQPPKDKLITLSTDNLRIASERRVEVEKCEAGIKAGVDFTFPWQNGKGTTDVKRYTLKEAVTQYLKTREVDGLRGKTLETYKRGLNYFCDVSGGSIPVKSICGENITHFKNKYKPIHSKTTLDIHLRAIVTFLNWLKDEGKIESIPKVKMYNEKGPPKYFSDSEYAEIQKAVGQMSFKNPNDNSHFQRAFHFYGETGCRLSEPFWGRVAGSFLIIPPQKHKTHQETEVYLTDELLQILYEMKSRFETNKNKSDDTFIKRYSKVFKKALRIAGIKGKNFHCLRHTFALRRYLETRDIYQVAKELGHSNISTTQIYTKFSLRRLEQDFPTLSRGYLGSENTSQNAGRDTDMGDTHHRLLYGYCR